MRFSKRNTYYLRISANAILPLYLYLDEQHVDWMDERILQHVLEDLRHKIPEKLASEADAHYGPGGPANAKKGTLDVHRGDTYQFGYFLRKTDPHSVLIKTRNFIAAPRTSQPSALPPHSPPKPVSAQTTARRKRPVPKRTSQKRKAEALSTRENSKKRKTKGKGKARATESDFEEEEDVIVISSDEEDVMTSDEPVIPAPSGLLRRSARNRTQSVGRYREDSEDAGEEGDDEVQAAAGNRAEDVPIPPPPTGTDTPFAEQDLVPIEPATPALDTSRLIAMAGTEQTEHNMTISIKSEDDPPISLLHPSTPPDTIPRDPDIPPPPGQPTTPPMAPIDLLGEDEDVERKPKPALRLSYQGFNVHGKCLCVIVEPWPPLPAAKRQVSLRPTGLVGPREPSIAPPDFVPSGGAPQRARTPLFLPDFDERERSQTPAPFAMPYKDRPPVPLFYDEPGDEGGEEGEEELGGGMYALSQVLRNIGDNTGIEAEDEDEISGAVLFGDADEAREL